MNRIFNYTLAILMITFSAPAWSVSVEDDVTTYQSQYKETADNVDIYDPIEPFNRVMYDFNDVADKLFLKNAALTYNFFIAPPVRNRVGYALQNLSEPVTLINNVFQGRPDRALTTFWRFAINSTVGFLGMFDVADNMGLKYVKEDFGQTLGAYGLGHGPYLVLPIIGPSSFRDATGRVTDYFIDPIGYVLEDSANYMRTGVNVIHTRSTSIAMIDDINRVSIDPYSTIRSLYLQSRGQALKE